MLSAILIETQVDLNFGKFERFEAQFYLDSKLIRALGFYDQRTKSVGYYPKVAESTVGKLFQRSGVGYSQELEGLVYISAMDEGTQIQVSRLGIDIERKTPIMAKYKEKGWMEKVLGYFSEVDNGNLAFYTRLEDGKPVGKPDIIPIYTIDKAYKLRRNPHLHFGEDQLAAHVTNEELVRMGRS